MDIFFFAAFIGLFAISINHLTVRKVPDCKGHQWVYDENDHMRCELCKKRPGQMGI